MPVAAGKVEGVAALTSGFADALSGVAGAGLPALGELRISTPPILAPAGALAGGGVTTTSVEPEGDALPSFTC